MAEMTRIRGRRGLVALVVALVGALVWVAPAQAEPAPAGPSASSVGSAYIPNLFSSTVSVLDLTSNTVTGTIPVSYPYGTAVSPDRRTVYVSSLFGGGTAGGDSVSVIDAVSKTAQRVITLGDYATVQPNGLAVDNIRKRLYVANSIRDTLGIVDLNTDTMTEVAVGDNPMGVALGPGGKMVYVSNYAAGTVSVFDANLGTVVATVTVGTNPTGVDVDLAIKRLFVANGGSSTVSVIDIKTNLVAHTVNLPAGATPEGISVRPGVLAVSNVGTGGISLIDTSTLATIRTLAVDGTWGIDIASNGSVVATLPASGEAAVIRHKRPASTTVVVTGSAPLGLGHFIAR